MPLLLLDRLARARSHAYRFPRAFWILLAGDAFQSLGFGLVTPYLALYLTQTVGASAVGAGVLLAFFGLTALVATPLGGVLADRLGRRPVMLAGLTGAAVAATAFGLAPNVWVVAAAIVVWAFFGSAFDPAASAYIADVAPRDLRTEAYGLKRVVDNAAFALGPPLGALLIVVSSLRVAFVLNGIALLVYLVIVWRRLPESRPAPDAHDEPVRFREALRDRLLVTLVLGAAVAGLIYATYETSVSVFLHEERGIAIATWGAVFGLNPILVTLLQFPVARWAGRRSARVMLATGAILYGLALALLVPFAGLAAVVAAVVVLTAGEMLIAPVSSALAADLAPPRLRGTYQSALNLAEEISWPPASILGLWLVGLGHGELVLAAALPLAAVAALLFLALPGRRVREEAAVATVDPLHP